MATVRTRDYRGLAHVRWEGLPNRLLPTLVDTKLQSYFTITAPVADGDIYRHIYRVPEDEYWFFNGFIFQVAAAAGAGAIEGCSLRRYGDGNYELTDNPSFGALDQYASAFREARAAPEYGFTLGWHDSFFTEAVARVGNIQISRLGAASSALMARRILAPGEAFIWSATIHLAAAEWAAGNTLAHYLGFYRIKGPIPEVLDTLCALSAGIGIAYVGL